MSKTSRLDNVACLTTGFAALAALATAATATVACASDTEACAAAVEDITPDVIEEFVDMLATGNLPS